MTYPTSYTPPPAPTPLPPQPQGEANSFYAQVMLWLAASFAVAAVGVFVIGPMVPPALILPLFGLVFIALIASSFARKTKKLMGVFAIAVPTALGVVLYPALNAYISSGSGEVVGFAAMGTALVFGVMAYLGWTSKKSLTHFLPRMFAVLIALIVLSLLNVFFFQLPVLSLVISLVVVVLFSVYTFIDIQRLRDRAEGDGMPASGYALNIFLNIYNIFVALLNIFGFASSD